MTTVVRTTTLEVYVHNGVEWQFDGGAYAATCSFGFDQRVAEATVRRTGGGEAEIQYWSPIEIKMGCDPGHGLATRFKGYVVPIDNALFPIDNVLTCRGHLYRAQWVRQTTPGGKVMAEPDVGASDEAQVVAVLEECGVPLPVPANIAGTGKDLGTQAFDFDNPTVPGPFTWAEGQAGLDYIDALDAVSVPDDASGRYRTFETLGGDVFRTKLATAPKSTPDFTFTEGVDVLEARITRDPGGAANRVTVTGAPTIIAGTVSGVEDLDVYRYTAAAPEGASPYLPPGLPNGPDGYPQVTTTFSSPMIEKSLIYDPGVGEPATGAHAYGASSPAFTPTATGGGVHEEGLRFSHPDGLTLLAVRWYRADAGATPPGALSLWDTTSTAAPVRTISGDDLLPYADTAVGWKTATLALPAALVAGRDYVVSWNTPTSFWCAPTYLPTPDDPLDVVANAYSAFAGAFPAGTTANACLLDPVVGDPGAAGGGDVISCEAVAQFLLAEHNCVLDTLELSTPRDDLLGPGQTIHLTAPRLGITDVDQHYWLQHLEVTVDERGVFTQRLVCLRRS